MGFFTVVRIYFALILLIFSSLCLRVFIILYDQLSYIFSFNFLNIQGLWITCKVAD